MISSPLAGLRILVVEDESIIALDIARLLAAAGATVIGPAHTVTKALYLIARSKVDMAILDYQLETETASPVADRLTAMQIPFLFHTSSRGRPEQSHPGVPIIDKPTRPEQLVAAVKGLTHKR
jgi:CheY-like chemotaxis protein